MTERCKFAIIDMAIRFKNCGVEGFETCYIELYVFYNNDTHTVDVFENGNIPYIFKQSTYTYDSIVDAVRDIALYIISLPAFECLKEFDVEYFHQMMASSHGVIHNKFELFAAMLDDKDDYDIIDHEGED